MSVRDVRPEDWQTSVLGADGLVLVDVWAPWCIPCKRLEPIVAAIAERHVTDGLTCVRLNADEAPELVAQYALLSLPTVLLMRGGQVLERVVGVPKRGRLDDLVATMVSPDVS
ncbi:MAG TPA: thioredoxin family protein [Miltoncostaeales bacterium]|nr:thioredoxin family protein [Miltoncostaeales bacterium]